jgi:succinate dehydrogenase / fumarate reductase membrane anchor subunit
MATGGFLDGAQPDTVQFLDNISHMAQIAERINVTTQNQTEVIAWKWMRYSGLLLIPLAWGHVLLQDVLVGVHRIDLDYVAMRWASIGWRTYDFLLLAFAFAHGMNGLRQVIHDYIPSEALMRVISRLLFVFWLVLAVIGAIAIIGGVRKP